MDPSRRAPAHPVGAPAATPRRIAPPGAGSLPPWAGLPPGGKRFQGRGPASGLRLPPRGRATHRRPVVRHGPKSPFGPVTTRAPGGGLSRRSPRP
ncbi:Conserved oligomeric Golgi complex component 8 [Actinacidiphila bryophytorum]|uniref:Conserved oligomeric Golgi complex component 8 n=1 Tax=Actinacidiphila bryophytorum TaxID=1436133 RepID=A0A9W4EDN0_9ACTN|nr:Conserved oligomeric Golgi complex component 8 [Actinacidiphila bryophytorum]